MSSVSRRIPVFIPGAPVQAVIAKNPIIHSIAQAMKFSDRYRFADWPNSEIPAVAAGVYAIWNGDELFYCGMSGRQIEQAISQRKKKFVWLPGLIATPPAALAVISSAFTSQIGG